MPIIRSIYLETIYKIISLYNIHVNIISTYIFILEIYLENYKTWVTYFLKTISDKWIVYRKAIREIFSSPKKYSVWNTKQWILQDIRDFYTSKCNIYIRIIEIYIAQIQGYKKSYSQWFDYVFSIFFDIDDMLSDYKKTSILCTDYILHALEGI